ncbi:hypothetical protein ISCGN_032936 [Ixodes scapularis]
MAPWEGSPLHLSKWMQLQSTETRVPQEPARERERDLLVSTPCRLRGCAPNRAVFAESTETRVLQEPARERERDLLVSTPCRLRGCAPNRAVFAEVNNSAF